MAAKKSAFTVSLPGAPPPPLPAVDAALTPLRDELAAIEALAATDPRGAQLRAEDLERRTTDHDAAARLLQLLPRELGDVAENPDYSAAKTAPQRKALDAAVMARVTARLARERTFAVLHAIAARDLDFQARAFAALDDWKGGSHLLRGALYAALVRAPALSPALAAHVRERALEKPPGELTGSAVSAVFQQGWAEELLWTALEQRTSMADNHHAKLVIEVGSSGGFFARDPDRWRPRLEELAKLADVPYDWTKGDEGRAPLQLGFAAREALEALASTPKAAKAPQKKPPKVPSIAAPIDRKKLRTSKAREAALDTLGAWLVDQLADADDARAREVIAAAISAFYDVREAADQERGEYAGHFFMVDGVGLDNTDRPVPWSVLRERVGDARVDALRDLFLEVEETVE